LNDNEELPKVCVHQPQHLEARERVERVDRREEEADWKKEVSFPYQGS